MLTLPIKKKWFDMICSGEKCEEYREIKPFYCSRFKNLFLNGITVGESWVKQPKRWISFRNGYSSKSRTIEALCSLHQGYGVEEWGAEKNKKYFVLTIHEIKYILNI